MGKKKLVESDSDDSDEDDEEKESGKSILLNSGNISDSSKDGDGSSDSVTSAKQDGEFSRGSSSESGSEEEEKESFKQENKEQNDASEPVTLEICDGIALVLETKAVQDEEINGSDPVVENVSSSSCVDGIQSTLLTSESCPKESDTGVNKETDLGINTADTETPLNFDQINSAAELEVRLRILIFSYTCSPFMDVSKFCRILLAF